MRKYFSFLMIAMVALFLNCPVHAQKAKDKVIATIQAFPYQHKTEADAALTGMGTWDKHEWKAFLKMLDDDSLKLNATYAMNAYVNASSFDAGKKNALIALLKKYASSSKTEYAKIFIQSQLKLLTDSSTVNLANTSLPKLPETKTMAASSLNSVQLLLALQDEMDEAKNPLQKKAILWKASRIPGFSSFMFVSKSLKDEEVADEAAFIVTRLALADETIKGRVVRHTLEKALPLIKGEDSACTRKSVAGPPGDNALRLWLCKFI